MTWVYFPIFIIFISWHYFFVKSPENSHPSLALFIAATFEAQIMGGLKSSLPIISNIFLNLRPYCSKSHLQKCVTGLFFFFSMLLSLRGRKLCKVTSLSIWSFHWKLTSVKMPKVWHSDSWPVVTAVFHYLQTESYNRIVKWCWLEGSLKFI